MCQVLILKSDHGGLESVHELFDPTHSWCEAIPHAWALAFKWGGDGREGAGDNGRCGSGTKRNKEMIAVVWDGDIDGSHFFSKSVSPARQGSRIGI